MVLLEHLYEMARQNNAWRQGVSPRPGCRTRSNRRCDAVCSRGHPPEQRSVSMSAATYVLQQPSRAVEDGDRRRWRSLPLWPTTLPEWQRGTAVGCIWLSDARRPCMLILHAITYTCTENVLYHRSNRNPRFTYFHIISICLSTSVRWHEKACGRNCKRR